MARKRADGKPDFDEKTRLIIGARAGFRCSYPGCDRSLIGPALEGDKFVNLGECGHIFAASPIGPRTDGGLDAIKLASIPNGIYLCQHHHGLVDRRSRSNKHTSEMLIRFKDRHEFNISAELGEHHYPLNWINGFKVVTSTLFTNAIQLMLGKVTFIYGENGSGKSLLIDLLLAAFTRHLEPRLRRREFEGSCEFEFDNPVRSKIMVDMAHTGQIVYHINPGKEETRQSFMPYHFNVLLLRDDLGDGNDDVGKIATCLRLERSFLLAHLDCMDFKDGLYAKEIQVKPLRRKPYILDRLTVRTEPSGDHYMPFGALSHSEQYLTIIDITIALANQLAAYQTVLLLIDWPHLFHLDKSNMSRVLELLRSKSSLFQSVVVSPNGKTLIDWSGWVIARLDGQVPDVTIAQNSLL